MLLATAMAFQMGLTPVFAADGRTVQDCTCPVNDSGMPVHAPDCLADTAPACDIPVNDSGVPVHAPDRLANTAPTCDCPVNDSGDPIHSAICPLNPDALKFITVPIPEMMENGLQPGLGTIIVSDRADKIGVLVDGVYQYAEPGKPVVIEGIYGQFTLNALENPLNDERTAAVTYTQDALDKTSACEQLREGQRENDVYSIRIEDVDGAFVNETLTINVKGTNDVPSITDFSEMTAQKYVGATASGTLEVYDVDKPDILGQGISLSAQMKEMEEMEELSTPYGVLTFGEFSLVAGKEGFYSATVTYTVTTPIPHEISEDRLQFEVADGDGGFKSKIVSIKVISATLDITGASDYVEITPTGYKVGGGAETSHIGGYIFTGTATDTNAARNHVTVSGGTHHIAFQDATIQLSANDKCAFAVEGGASVDLVLLGTNTLKSAGKHAGLEVGAGNTVTITEAGTGSLNATGGDYGAGIGGGNGGAGGTVTISSGAITATGGSSGAGIGGGNNGAGGNTTISGGTVTATGGDYGAGIGGGNNGAGGRVAIDDAVVYARKGANAPNHIGAGASTTGGTVARTSGIIFEGAIGKVYGSVTLPHDLTITATQILIVTADATLTIPDSITLQNNGILYNHGTITGNISGTPPVAAGDAITLNISDAGNYVEITSTGFKVSGNEEILHTGGYIITGTATDTNAQKNHVMVSGGTHNITLKDTDIQLSDADKSAFAVDGGSTVALTLAGTNTLKSGSGRAGLEVGDGNTLTITEASTGSLNATGSDYGAGIGGGNNGAGGEITIIGGTVTATGNGGGAGIGGGNNGAGGTVTINDGMVDATGNSGGAGIGGGNNGDGGIITISGGEVKATGGIQGAGIGGGWGGTGGTGGEITISGGTVEATGGNYGAGIGGGYNGAGGKITISGGEVKAIGGDRGAGIGGGIIGEGGEITINGGEVKATGNGGGSGIGGGNNGDGDKITINGGMITATGNGGGAGIGGGNNGDGGAITISGGTVEATGGENGAGIGGGGGVNVNGIIVGGDGGEITISGGTVEATGNGGGSGIGGGNNGDGGAITINGDAVVFAQKGANAPNHIGAGASTTGGTVARTRGIIFEGTTGRVYGSVTLTRDLTITEAQTLVVAASTTLTIPGSITLQNNGTIYKFGTVNGTVRGNPFSVLGDTVTLNISDAGNYVEITATGYKVGGDAEIPHTGGYIITGTATGTHAQWNHVMVSGGTHNITLKGADIQLSDYYKCAFVVEGGSTVSLTLADTNTLKSGSGRAGLEVGDGNTLTITESSTGSLAATGGSNGAGIGGGVFGAGGVITISGGMVTATTGGSLGAGIGGGQNGDGGEITISGGTVKAIGGENGAGIGGGYYGAGGAITINGGAVKATGGLFGAGIGGGFQGAGGEITISGGEVKATGGNHGAGIGGGVSGAGGTVAINGDAVVFAQKGANAPNHIGAGYNATGGTVAKTRGVIFEGNSGKVYGDSVTLATNTTIPAGKTLTLEEEHSLLIPAEITLTNNGVLDGAGFVSLLRNSAKVNGSGAGNHSHVKRLLSGDTTTIADTRMGTPLAVTWDGVALTENTDFTVSDFVVGTSVPVTVTGMGDYRGSVTKSITVRSLGGGDYSSGSGKSTPLIAPKQPTAPTVSAKTTTDKNGNATAKINDLALLNAIKKAQKNAKQNGIAVTIDVKTAKNAKSLEVTLSQTAVTALRTAKATQLTIQNGIATLTIDLAALNALGSGEVKLTVGTVDVKFLSAEAQAAIGSRPVYRVGVTVGGKAVTDLKGGKIGLNVPYARTKAERIGNLGMVHIGGSGKPTWLGNSRYDPKTGMVLASATNPSVYGVGYKPSAAQSNRTIPKKTTGGKS